MTKGTPPTLSVAVDGNTNRVVGLSYDNAGNQLTLTGSYNGEYDYTNRLVKVREQTTEVARYEYDPRAQRVYSSETGVPDGTSVYFYGIDGTLLAAYTPTPYGGSSYMVVKKRYVYLGSRVLAEWRSASTDYGPVKLLLPDRLNSEQPQGSEEAYPYGEPKTGTSAFNYPQVGPPQ